MGLFWKRKSGDQFVSLKLNEPTAPEAQAEDRVKDTRGSVRAERSVDSPAAPAAVLEPAATGAGPTPIPYEQLKEEQAAPASRAEVPALTIEARQDEISQKSVPSRSPFATSVLGLNLSMEELQAQEAALEQEFSARFRRAVAATRESLSGRLDTVFQGLKQIDENLFDELDEALIAADIGVSTTQHILETVRRGVARKQINDLDTLKRAIKDELLKILRQSERQGVSSETNVPENITPYVMMIVGVNGVGKTTTIGKLAQRIKAEGNDVLICAADTFRAAASDQLAR